MAGREAGLLERDAELRACQELIVGVREGRGGLLMFEGPAGVGKSALLQRLRRAAPAAGVRVLFTRGTELGRSVPFGVARRLLEPVVREQPELLDVGLGRSRAADRAGGVRRSAVVLLSRIRCEV